MSASMQQGALVIIDPVSGQRTGTISFQFNPSSFTRTLTPQTDWSQAPNGARRDATRFTGTPKESFSVTIQVDGLDQLPGFRTFSGQTVGSGDTTVQDNGIAPMLAAMETLVYPDSALITSEDQALANGAIEVAPKIAPLVLFSWGKNRLIPVNLDTITVAEEAFDQNLNPVRATVTLAMSVLSASDLAPDSKAYSYYMTYQKWKESGAKLAAAWRFGS